MKKVVIAESFPAYRSWILRKRLKPQDFYFVDNLERCYGMAKGTECYLVGQYWLNKVYDTEMFRSRRFILKGEDDI